MAPINTQMAMTGGTVTAVVARAGENRRVVAGARPTTTLRRHWS